MTYVLEMSTDPDIVNTGLNAAWNPITARYSWAQVSNGADSDGSRPGFRDQVAHHSDLMSPGVPG
jgi:hypothetical protein